MERLQLRHAPLNILLRLVETRDLLERFNDIQRRREDVGDKILAADDPVVHRAADSQRVDCERGRARHGDDGDNDAEIESGGESGDAHRHQGMRLLFG